MTTKRYHFTKTTKRAGNITVPRNITGKLQGILFVGSTVIILNFILAFFYNYFYFSALEMDFNLVPLSIEDFILPSFQDFILILFMSGFLLFVSRVHLTILVKKIPPYIYKWISMLNYVTGGKRDTPHQVIIFLCIGFALFVLLMYLDLNEETKSFILITAIITFAIAVGLFAFDMLSFKGFCECIVLCLFVQGGMYSFAFYDIKEASEKQIFLSIDSKSYPLIRTLEKGFLVLKDKSIVFVANDKIDVVEYKIGSKVYEMLTQSPDEKDNNTTLVPDKVDTNPNDKALTPDKVDNKDSDAVSGDKVDNKDSDATPLLDNVEVPTLKE